MSTIIKTDVLENGLTVVVETNKNAKSAALGFFVKTGGRDEFGSESGLSHFLEHMMFKGTAKRNAEAVNFDLGNIGAQANAYTSEEATVYYAGILPEYFANLFEILSDMLRPSLDSKEFYMEQKVILEEIALYQDKPQFWFFQELSKDYYGSHTLGQPVLGTNESVSSFTPEAMRAYFDRKYCASNIVLCASGPIEFNDVYALAKQHCAAWEKGSVKREYVDFAYQPKQKSFFRPNLNQSQLVFLWPGVGSRDSMRFAYALYSAIVGDSVGSRLYWSLVDAGLADSASMSHDENDGIGQLMAYASCMPESMESVASIISKEISNSDIISEEELQRAKTKFKSRIVSRGELPMGRMMSLGNAFLYRGEAVSLDRIIEDIDKVSLEEVLVVAKHVKAIQPSFYQLMPE